MSIPILDENQMRTMKQIITRVVAKQINQYRKSKGWKSHKYTFDKNGCLLYTSPSPRDS